MPLDGLIDRFNPKQAGDAVAFCDKANRLIDQFNRACTDLNERPRGEDPPWVPITNVVVKITATAGGGAYTGSILTSQMNAAKTAAFTFPQGMNETDVYPCVVYNQAESGQS